jgi:hypothetical protein
MRLFSSVFRHRTLAVFSSLAGVFLLSGGSCTILKGPRNPVGTQYGTIDVAPRAQCEPGSKTFTVAGNGTLLNQFSVPVGCMYLTVRAWAGGGGGGGGQDSRGNSDNTGYGGGGGGGGGYQTAVLYIVTYRPPPPSGIVENSLLIMDVGAGGLGGKGAPTGNRNTDRAGPGQPGTITKVTAVPTYRVGGAWIVVKTSGNYGGGSGVTTFGIGGRGFCADHGTDGSDTARVVGGNGGSGCSDGGAGGSGGADPGCNNLGKDGSGGNAPGGGGGGGSGGRTCGWQGGRHSGGSGGRGADGQVEVSWR